MESAARNGDVLTTVVTTWIALDTLTAAPVTLYRDSLRTTSPRRMALLTSWFGDRFHPASVLRLAGDSAALGRAAGFTARALEAGGHRGLLVDFEGHTASDLPALLRVVRTLADTVRARRLGPLTVAIPAVDTAYPARAFIEAGADFVLPMLYDQHWAGGSAGPVAEPAWVASALDRRIDEVGASRIVAALPLYGYRWPAAGAGVTVTLGEALSAARNAGVELSRDTATGTLRGSIPGSGEIWVTDPELLGRLIDTVTARGVERIALWHIGQEDRSMWPVLRARLSRRH